MSGSSEFIQFSGRKLPEKPRFSQTCNRLSEYLKEKGSFGDLSLGMTCRNNADANGIGSPEITRQNATTMNLFPMIDKPVDVSSRNVGIDQNRFMDLFPQQVGLTHSASKEDVQIMPDSSVNKNVATEPKTAQMTIFYAGQVVVFDDFPADKAKEIMSLADKGVSRSQVAFPYVPAKSPSTFTPNLAKTPPESSSSVPPSSSPTPTLVNNLIQERVQPPHQPVASDLPIARRASLHRFLEKRKDRLTAKAPYQTSGSPGNPANPVDSKPWLGLAARPLQ